jgi:LPS-assembly lipoprotein
MSSSDRRVPSVALRARRAFVLGSIGLAALALGGCLRPLYGSATVGGAQVQDRLAAIEVGPIPDRIGHYLRNELVFDLDGSGNAPARLYRLSITVTENLDVTVTDYSTGRADSATLVVTASYQLVEQGTNKELFTGVAVARAAYDRSAQRFANLRAARNAQERAAKSLSNQIRNRLAAGFAGGF